tara:strand:- start:280 stop:492 length:213 start_codon:yes stop_codon:yes gene_type:complete
MGITHHFQLVRLGTQYMAVPAHDPTDKINHIHRKQDHLKKWHTTGRQTARMMYYSHMGNKFIPFEFVSLT